MIKTPMYSPPQRDIYLLCFTLLFPLGVMEQVDVFLPGTFEAINF